MRPGVLNRRYFFGSWGDSVFFLLGVTWYFEEMCLLLYLGLTIIGNVSAAITDSHSGWIAALFFFLVCLTFLTGTLPLSPSLGSKIWRLSVWSMDPVPPAYTIAYWSEMSVICEPISEWLFLGGRLVEKLRFLSLLELSIEYEIPRRLGSLSLLFTRVMLE